MTFRVMQINDVHLADQPPRSRNSLYREHILGKLQAAMDLVHPRRIDHVVITGDLFHRHQAAHTSHDTVQRVRRILNSPGVPVSLVVGNHDKARGGVLEGQPLLSVLGDNVTLLEGPHPHRDIAGFGWTNELAGTEEEIEDYLAQRSWNVDRALVFVHAPIVLEPFPFGPAPAGWVTAVRVVNHLNPRTRYLGHGHIHGGHDPAQFGLNIVENGPHLTIANPGALSRATIAGDDAMRIPQVAIITLDDSPEGHGRVEVEYQQLPFVPVEDAFLLAQHGREEVREDNIKVLAATLLAGAMHVVTADSLIDALRRQVIPDTFEPELYHRAQEMAIAAIEEVTK